MFGTDRIYVQTLVNIVWLFFLLYIRLSGAGGIQPLQYYHPHCRQFTTSKSSKLVFLLWYWVLDRIENETSRTVIIILKSYWIENIAILFVIAFMACHRLKSLVLLNYRVRCINWCTQLHYFIRDTDFLKHALFGVETATTVSLEL